MAVIATSVAETCAAAKRAAAGLASMPSGVKDGVLEAIAAALVDRTPEILEANARDLEAGREAGLTDALMDRLALDERRVSVIASQVHDIAALPDPVGEVIEGRRLANGLDVRKVRVPLGVIAVVYEARPNVTIDAAALCLKSGNAIVLRGSSMAAHSNAVLASVAIEAGLLAGLPEGAMSLVAGGGHEELAELATQSGVVDLIIPRGGDGLKAALKGVATVPVMYAASGNCHVYVDATASLEEALAITLNAKVQRPSVCNAAETLLVHVAVAEEFLPVVLSALADSGVELRGDVPTQAHARGVPVSDATDEDWAREYLSLDLAVRVVDSLDEALDHIRRWSSGHTEAIVSQDVAAVRRFVAEVDAAAVMVNASTRFTDGGELGLGAEIGISTQKLHARGPMGLAELTTTTWVVTGEGHVRA
jgi:glutamate-5-semialdehyde dehydrogenase